MASQSNPTSNPTPTSRDGKEEAWQELCKQAVRETDPEQLIKLAEQINHALEEREKRLNPRAESKGAA